MRRPQDTPAVIAMHADARLAAIQRWLPGLLGDDFALAPASADASFRRYFRAVTGTGSFIVMDAPPDKEDCRPFIHAAAAFGARGLNVPRVLHADLSQGLLLLTDLGARTYLGS